MAYYRSHHVTHPLSFSHFDLFRGPAVPAYEPLPAARPQGGHRADADAAGYPKQPCADRQGRGHGAEQPNGVHASGAAIYDGVVTRPGIPTRMPGGHAGAANRQLPGYTVHDPMMPQAYMRRPRYVAPPMPANDKGVYYATYRTAPVTTLALADIPQQAPGIRSTTLAFIGVTMNAQGEWDVDTSFLEGLQSDATIRAGASAVTQAGGTMGVCAMDGGTQWSQVTNKLQYARNLVAWAKDRGIRMIELDDESSTASPQDFIDLINALHQAMAEIMPNGLLSYVCYMPQFDTPILQMVGPLLNRVRTMDYGAGFAARTALAETYAELVGSEKVQIVVKPRTDSLDDLQQYMAWSKTNGYGQPGIWSIDFDLKQYGDDVDLQWTQALEKGPSRWRLFKMHCYDLFTACTRNEVRLPIPGYLQV